MSYNRAKKPGMIIGGKGAMREKIGIGIAVGLLFLLMTVPWWYHSRQTRPLEPPAQSGGSRIASKKHSDTRHTTPGHQAAPPKDRHAGTRTRHSTPPTLADLRNLSRKARWPRLVHIPEGSPGEIFASLKRQGVPLWGLDRLLLLPSRITPGWIRIERPLSLAEFFRRINDFPRERTRRVVMYSGDSLDDFVRQFSRQTRLSKRSLFEEYFRFSPYIDGGILAGFYRLPYRLSPGPAMAYLTGRSEKRFAALAGKHLGDYDPQAFKRYLIVASIIQRETWHPEEMAHIASVIYNRLKQGMRLQIDATLNYGPYSHIKVTPDRIRRDNSRFNTYKFKGLPPEPLGSVTEAALEAALNPTKSTDLYFVRDITGSHVFAPDYASHLANIAKIRVQRARLNRIRRSWKGKHRH